MTTTPDAARTVEPFPLDVDAILLDMDGTLVDSGAAVERSWNQLLDELGLETRFTHTMHGVPARLSLRQLLPDASEEQLDAAHRRIEEIEIRDVDGIEVLPGTARVLAELEAASAALGRPAWTIVTSCTRELFEARWATTGLPAPAATVTADQVTRGKPDPEPFVTGATRLGIAPARCLAVEDSLGGIRSAGGAGCRTVAVTTTTPAADLTDLADALITSLDDIEVTVHEGRLRVQRRGA